MTPITFAPAVRENVGILIALAGASGCGKTFSALRLAKGLAGGKPIAFIDTEARRGLHYADQFNFLHADLRPPFRPERFIEAIHAAEQAGAAVVIVDSMSHEYDGEGGIIDWADQLAERGVKSPGNWKDPKQAHKKMMNALLQCRASLIFCLRADEKIEIVREGGKTQVRPLGWMPICEKRFMYEMTASFTLTPDAPGRPRFDLPHKLQEQHRAIFGAGSVIDERAGEALAAWARGGVPAAATTNQAPAPATKQPGTFRLALIEGPPFSKTKRGIVEAIEALEAADPDVIEANEQWLSDMAELLPDLAPRIAALSTRANPSAGNDDGWPGPQ